MIDNLWQREQKFVNVINAMECRGVRIDQAMCRRKIAIGEAEMNRIRKELHCNPGSKKDLEFLLIGELGLPIVRRSTKTNAPSFDKTAMAEYDQMLEHRGSKIAKQITAYRGWQNATAFYKGFLDKVSYDGRLRTNYWIHGTKTTRLSSRNPNLQNIPKEQEDPAKKPWSGDMKEVFLPPEYPEKHEWVLLNADFGQLELRLGAAYSGERKLLEIFNDPTRHVFRDSAASMGQSYNAVKTYFYASAYGAQYKKIGQILGLEPAESIALHESFIKEYPLFTAFPDRVKAEALRKGYIKYWTGRRRHLVDKRDANKMFNSLLQGGGAEIVKSAMIRVFERVQREGFYHMLLQVHDSIVGEARVDKIEEIKQMIVDEMSRVHEEWDFGLKFTVATDYWGPMDSRLAS
jgi:DNA polymerase-1